MSIFRTVSDIEYRNILQNVMYPWIKTFDDLNSWTSVFTGSGAFTPGWPQGLLTTGAASGSSALINATAVPATSGLFFRAGVWDTYYKIRTQPRNSNSALNSFFLFGIIDNPASPLLNNVQTTFRILNGDVTVCCGNGVANTTVSTGLTLGDFASDWQYSIYHTVGRVEFVITLGDKTQVKTTITTTLPNNAYATPSMYISNSAAAEKNMWFYPMVVMQN